MNQQLEIRERVARAWRAGWQPAELARQVRRTTDAATARLSLVAISADHAHRDRASLDARWIAQLEDLQLPRVDPTDDWIDDWARRDRIDGRATARAALALLRALSAIRSLPILIPPPGSGGTCGPIIDLTAHSNDPILKRVRALLAQAESTTFEAEAETFTAKAQELMARHAIDMAMVAANSRTSERPETIRIPIDEPYVSGKSLLLQIVAEASRCRAVFHPGFAMSSIVGFAGDLAATETLFTALLIQAQVAMRAASSSAPAGTRSRSRSFRSSFLLAYAHRIAERLAEINARVMADAEAEIGASLLPVLASRSSVVDESVGETFGRLRSTPSRREIDPAGWSSGRSAADRARLNRADLTESAASR